MKRGLHQSSDLLNVRAGLLAAAGWGAAGALAAAAIVAGLDSGVSYVDAAAAPILGCGAVLASAGWAAHAPRLARKFAVSLLAVFVGSLLLWMLLSVIRVTPRRHKSGDHPLMYPSEGMVLVVPPLLMAAVLTARWSGGSRQASGGR